MWEAYFNWHWCGHILACYALACVRPVPFFGDFLTAMTVPASCDANGGSLDMLAMFGMIAMYISHSCYFKALNSWRTVEIALGNVACAR